MKSLYLRATVWDFILTALASVSLAYVLLNGFYVAPALQYSPIPAVVVLVCLVALYLIARSRRVMLIGGIVYAVVLFALWGVAIALTPGGAIFVDNETNYLIFSMIVTLVPTLAFLVSRPHVGAALLFIGGAFLLGLIQLFYERFEVVWSVLFVLSALALVIYRNYQKSVRGAMGVEKVSFSRGFLVAVASCAIACGIGLAVWYGIIAPLDPGALDIKLVTEYRALETVQVRGTSDLYQTPNLDMTSDDLNSGQRTTDDIKESLDGSSWPATGETSEEPQDGDANDSVMGMNLDSLQDMFDLLNNPQNWPLVLIFILLIALIVLYFFLRRLRRGHRLKKFAAEGPDREFCSAFLFLVGRFDRVGVLLPEGQTVLEFGVSSKAGTRFVDEATGVAFEDLAATYSGMVYGKRHAQPEDISAIEAFYRGFWKGARKQLGNVRYFFKSFRL